MSVCSRSGGRLRRLIAAHAMEWEVGDSSMGGRE
jgi:hypothetical protein